MNPDSRQTVHLGVNFVFAPPPSLDSQKFIQWQRELGDRGLEFEHTTRAPEGFKLGRTQGGPLEVQINIMQPGLGQCLALRTHPLASTENFAQEAEEIVEALDAVWPGQRQIVSKDCTIRHLYFSAAEHAFKYLWETRFHQPEDDLAVFGRPVSGGGLRFVMPPTEPHLPAVEVKIESFLRDSSKVFVETQFVWRQPGEPGTPLNPRAVIEEVEAFATDEVVRFIQKT